MYRNFTIKNVCFNSYGLLGPSGCGKSTLLQCILGTITLDSGSIEFSAKSLKDVGYMPQVRIYLIYCCSFDVSFDKLLYCEGFMPRRNNDRKRNVRVLWNALQHE